MGKGQVEAAALYAHGATGTLALEQLPHHGELVTASLSGLTDSAAAGTAMSSGVKTMNRRIGLDRDARRLVTATELAHPHGLSAGIVSSALLPHATLAAFSAHGEDRDDYVDLASDQAVVRPDVMLGGGRRFYLRGLSRLARTRVSSHLSSPRTSRWFTIARSSRALFLPVDEGSSVCLLRNTWPTSSIEMPPTLSRLSRKCR